MKKFITLMAVAGLVLALAPAAQAAATWNGSVDDKWSNMGNWDSDPTAGGDLTLLVATTSTVDTDTSGWAIGEVLVSGGTLNVVDGGTLVASRLRPSGGNVIQTGGVVDISDRIHSLNPGTVTISGGSWDVNRWTYVYGGTLHIIGTNSTLVKHSSYGDLATPSVTQWFTLEAGGVTKHTAGSAAVSTTGSTTIQVDGIPAYLAGSGSGGDVLPLIEFSNTDPDWPAHAVVDDDPVGSGFVDSGKGLVTITPTGATLTILGAPSVWDGGVGNWSNSNWSVGQAPGTAIMTVDADNTDAVSVTTDTNCTVLLIGENNTSTVSINATKTLTVDYSVSVGASGTLNVNGTLDTLTLNSANVIAFNASSAGTIGTVNVTGGTADFAAGSTVAITTLNTAGATTLEGSGTIGTVNLTGGTLTRSSALALGTLSVNGGTLAVSGAITASTAINLTGPLTVDNVLDGTAAVNILGGTVTLDAANGYSGGTFMSGGSTLVVAAADSLGTGTVTFNASGSTLSLLNNNGTDFVRNIAYADNIPATINVGSDGGAIASQVHELGNFTTGNGNHTLTVTGNEGYGLTLGAISVNKNYTINNNSDGLLTIASVGPAGGNRALSFNGTGDTTVSGSVTLSSPTTGYIRQNGVSLTTLEGNVTGDIQLLVGTLTLDGSYQLDIEGNGTVSTTFEQITGDAGDDETLNLNGSFDFDVSGADETLGNTWQIVDMATIFDVNYAADFVVTGATKDGGAAGSRVWSFPAAVNPALGYEFDESTGVLTLVAVVDPAATLSDGHTGSYRIIFVTTGTLQPISSDIADYNTFVDTEAKDAASTETKDFSTTWTAVGSTGTVDARTNTGTTGAGTNIHIYTPTATAGTYQLVATSYTDLWDGSIATGIRYGDGTENNPGLANLGSEQIWTGTNVDGTSASSGDGRELGSGPSPNNIRLVRGGRTDGHWISSVSDHDASAKHFMGISGLLPPPAAPVITQGAGPLAETILEDTNATWAAADLNATDADVDDVLTWSVETNATNGVATVSGTGSNPSTFTYVPNGDFNGNDSFVVQVSDGDLNDTITVNVTVTAVNDAPVITQAGPLAETNLEDANATWVAADLNATDADVDDVLTWSVETNATNGVATVSGTGSNPTTFTYAPNADFNGSDSFVVQVSDGDLNDTITVNVTVTAVNDAPVITQGAGPLPVTMSEDGSPTAWVAPTLGATDEETADSALVWSVSSAASNGTATVTGTAAAPTTFTYAS